MKGKTSELKTLEMNLLNYKEDRETTGKELDAVLAYLDKLKPQCETKVRMGQCSGVQITQEFGCLIKFVVFRTDVDENVTGSH